MKDLDEGVYWVACLVVALSAAAIISCVCYTAAVERDKAAFARGYQQRIEQARLVWVKP